MSGIKKIEQEIKSEVIKVEHFFKSGSLKTFETKVTSNISKIESHLQHNDVIKSSTNPNVSSLVKELETDLGNIRVKFNTLLTEAKKVAPVVSTVVSAVETLVPTPSAPVVTTPVASSVPVVTTPVTPSAPVVTTPSAPVVTTPVTPSAPVVTTPSVPTSGETTNIVPCVSKSG